VVKRAEVKIIAGLGAPYWAPAQVIGCDDNSSKTIVEYIDLQGKTCVADVDDWYIRYVDAEITNELLREAATLAAQHIKNHFVTLDDAEVEHTALTVWEALQRKFGYPT